MFKGGVKLLDFKSLSKNEKIEEFKYPEKVIIPLSQHTGSPAKPVVKKGDYVVEGQIIGEITGFISSNIHSSVSGKVIDIVPWDLPTGKRTMSVIIESDGEGKSIEKIKRDWLSLSKEEIINIVRDSGIVGLGGAAFPTHVKLTIPPGKKAEYVIINGCECEPFLTCDFRLMVEESENIVKGIEIIKKLLNPKKVFIGIEDNKIEAAKEIDKFIKARNLSDSTEVVILKTKYPQGSEKHLIKAITGREVPSGGLPFDVGCVVQNVQTVFAIKEAIYDGKPLIERVITVSGSGVKESKNLRVKIGTFAEEIIKYCGGVKGEIKKVIFGGPMMGFSSYTLKIPITKGTSGILIFTEKEVKDFEEYPCIRCGRCADACPMYLMPMLIDAYSRIEDFTKAKYYGAIDCIECGACAYVCPSKRHLVQSIRFAKSELLKKK